MFSSSLKSISGSPEAQTGFSASALVQAHRLLEPIVKDFWAQYKSVVRPIQGWSDYTRSPKQIQEQGGEIHFLSCFERTAVLSQMLLERGITHRMILCSIKRFCSTPKPGTSLELDIDGNKITFLSANSCERVVDKLPQIGVSGITAMAYADPYLDRSKSYLDFFCCSNGVLPEFMQDPEIRFAGFSRVLRKSALNMSRHEEYANKRRTGDYKNSAGIIFQVPNFRS